MAEFDRIGGEASSGESGGKNVKGSSNGFTAIAEAGGKSEVNKLSATGQYIGQQYINYYDDSAVRRLEEATRRAINTWTWEKIEMSVCDDIIQNITKKGKPLTSIVGDAGDGLTTLGYMVLKKLSHEHHFRVFKVCSSYDCLTVLREDFTDSKCVVMLNSVFGDFGFDCEACKLWTPIITEFLENAAKIKERGHGPRIHILFVSREYNLKKAEQMFSKRMLIEEMFSGESYFHLGKRSKDKELYGILDHDLKKYKITDVDKDSKERVVKRFHNEQADISRTTHSPPLHTRGIPYASRMYCEIRSQRNDFFNIEDFFQSPLRYLNETMIAFVQNAGTKNLFRRLLQSGGLLKLAELDDDNLREHVRCIAKPLHGYVENNLDELSWTHPSIMASFVVTYGRDNPEFIIKNCDFSVLYHFAKVKERHFAKVKERGLEHRDDWLLLEETQTVLKALCARFKQRLLDGYYEVLGHDFCQRDNFIEMLLGESLGQEETSNEAVGNLHINKEGAWQDQTLLHVAVDKANVRAVEILLCRHANVNKRDAVGQTALHIAFKQFSPDNYKVIHIIQLLTQKNANINIADEQGYTPLRVLCENRNVTAEMLVRLLNMCDGKVSDDLLHSLCGNTSINLELLAAMLKAGAEANSLDVQRYTPLHRLCMNTGVSVDMLVALLEAGSNASSQDSSSYTPLHHLCSNKCVTVGMLQALLKAEVSVNSYDKDGHTPLHHLCENTSVTAELLAAMLGAEAGVKNLDDKLLHLLCMNTAVTAEMLGLLLKAGANVKSCDDDGYTPLDRLCMNNAVTVEMLDRLLNAEANVNSRGNDGNTPLIRLCMNASVTAELLASLLKKEADIMCHDPIGRTPIFFLLENPAVAGAATEMMERAKYLTESTGACLSEKS